MENDNARPNCKTIAAYYTGNWTKNWLRIRGVILQDNLSERNLHFDTHSLTHARYAGWHVERRQRYSTPVCFGTASEEFIFYYTTCQQKPLVDYTFYECKYFGFSQEQLTKLLYSLIVLLFIPDRNLRSSLSEPIS